MNRLTIVRLVIVAILVIVATFAPWIATHDVGTTNLSLRYLPPSSQYFFGTDSTGRDIFSRVDFGAHITLKVSLLSWSRLRGNHRHLPLGVGRLLRRLDRQDYFWLRLQCLPCLSRLVACDRNGGFPGRRPQQTDLCTFYYRLGGLCAFDSRADLKVREYDFVQLRRWERVTLAYC